MNHHTSESPEKKKIVCPYCQGTLFLSQYSSLVQCQNCKRQINVKELPGTNNQKQKFEIEKRKLFCYKCGKEIIADKNAQAVICKYCYQRNDLSDHKLKTIFGAVIQTHGQLYLQKKGIIATSTIQVGNAVIRGKVIGDITAQGSVEILKKGEVRGNITCRSLIVRKGGIFVGYLYLQNTDGEHISTERIREQHQTVKH